MTACGYKTLDCREVESDLLLPSGQQVSYWEEALESNLIFFPTEFCINFAIQFILKFIKLKIKELIV